MGRKRRDIALLLHLLCASMPAAAGAATDTDDGLSIFGLWREPRRQAVVRVYPCGDRLCGDMVWLPPGAVAVDRNNPDPTLRARSLIGLKVIDGFSPADGTGLVWTGGGDQGRIPGRIYVPANGDTLGDAENTYVIRLRDRDALTIGIGNCVWTCFATSQWERVRPLTSAVVPD
jgi:uncharacterized protein (DUF2147 family)